MRAGEWAAPRVAWRLRATGEEHWRTLEARQLLSQILFQQDKHEEARTIRAAILPVCLRVLGPHHTTTCSVIQANSLDASRFDSESD